MLRCSSVTVRFGETLALDDVDLSLASGRVGALIGPSGSGKSTLLRTIAGLEHPQTGSVAWKEIPLDTVPPHQRGVGLMFQDYALFPHLDVAGNIGFGPSIAGLDQDRTASRTNELLELVGLPGFGPRDISTLSGGEQQRVALARTLAPEPDLVMLDEPLGALDRTLREQLIPDMRRIFESLDTTVLYVTHDHDEAFAVADELFVMREGRIAGTGTPRELWRRPPDIATARFFGFTPELGIHARNGRVDLGFGEVATSEPDGAYTALLRPGALTVATAGAPAVVTGSRYTTSGYVLDVALSGLAAEAVSPRAADIGTTVLVAVDSDAVVLYETVSPSSSDV